MKLVLTKVLRESAQESQPLFLLFRSKKINVLLGICLLMCARAAYSQDNLLLRISPPPVKLESVNNPVFDLAGTWHYNRNPCPQFWGTFDLRTEKWSDYQVPGEIEMEGLQPPFDNAAAACKTFRLPEDYKGNRIFLRANGINGECDVWVNKELVGKHAGGFTAFERDVTDAIDWSGENTIVVKITYRCLANDLACAAYAKHNISGINRSIYLFAAPKQNATSFHVETVFDENYVNATMRARLTFVNQADAPSEEGTLTFALSEKNGAPVPLKNAGVKVPPMASGEVRSAAYEFAVNAPKQWNCDHPNLYVLQAELAVRNQVAVTYQRRFGFRQLEIRGTKFFVNNTAVKLHGVCRHEIDPLRGRSILPELAWKDAQLFRDGNVNFVRTSHYPPSEEFIEACDELGIFVCEEAPFCFTSLLRKIKELSTKKSDLNLPPLEELQKDPMGADKLMDTSKFPPIPYAPIVYPTLEMIERDRSHPSIIMWSMGNESGEGPDFAEAAKQSKISDPTRPVTFSFEKELNFADVRDVHYAPGAVTGVDKPAYLGEFCLNSAAFNRSPQEAMSDPGVIEYWTVAVKHVWESVYQSDTTIGGTLWAGVDEKFHIPRKKPEGIARWGIIDEWRRPKPEYAIVKKIFSPIQIRNTHLSVPAAGEAIEIRIENRHDFANLSEVAFNWTLAGEKGEAHTDIAAGKSGTLKITPKNLVLAGSMLRLVCTSPRSSILDEFCLPIGAQRLEPVVAKDRGRPQLTQDGETVQIRLGKSMWCFNRKTGAVKCGLDGKEGPVITGGPHLWISCLETDAGRDKRRKGRDSLEEVPYDGLCTNWKFTKLEVTDEAGCVSVQIQGAYNQAGISYTFAFTPGGVELAYKLKSNVAVSPRQIGVLFDLPKEYDTLSWERASEWTVLPDDHISRLKGTTRAFRDPAAWPAQQYRVKPSWPWSLDQNPQGTKDFRSTKRDVTFASLTATDGSGLAYPSDGNHSVRSYIDDQVIRFMIAGYNRPGSWEHELPFFKRLKLQNGSTFSDTVNLQIIKD
jgi:hypothetical protein